MSMMKKFTNTKRVYLDWASAAPVLKEAQKAFLEASKLPGNPSSPHEEGVAAKEVLERARTTIARLAGVKSSAVVFTSGATEANALAIQGRIKRLHSEGILFEKMHVLYLPTMHSSALRIAALQTLGVRTEAIRLHGFEIDLQAFEKQLNLETVLVTLDAVCGETGTRFDTRRVRVVVDAASTAKTSHAMVHIDATQLPMHESIELLRLGADAMTLDSQKIGGVRGVGALVIPNHRFISPLLQGGGQENGLRPGTEPVALIASFAEALALRAKGAVSWNAAAVKTRESLIESIQQLPTPVSINEGKKQIPSILNISIPGIDTDYLVMLLDAAGFAVSTKSACETDSTEGSIAVGIFTGDTARALSTLRISWGPETSAKEVQDFTIALKEAVHFLTNGPLYYT